MATVEEMLRSTGDLDFRDDRPPTGLFSAPLRDAIGGFQRRNRLTTDRIVNPDGETVQALVTELDLDDEEDDGAVDCRRLENRVRNARANLAKWMGIREEDEARIGEAERRVDEARAVLAAAAAAAARPRVRARSRGGLAIELGAVALGVVEAAATLETAENELARERGRLKTTLLNIDRVEAELRSAQSELDARC